MLECQSRSLLFHFFSLLNKCFFRKKWLAEEAAVQVSPHKILHKTLNNTLNKTFSGIYLYGEIGRGKTTLMQQIFDDLAVPKQNLHFDAFFGYLHNSLIERSLSDFVAELSKKNRVIWIDEVQIYDIATAMLFKNLVTAFVEHKVILLMTGNVAPENFYKNGLNRDQFVSFIPFFCNHVYCLALEGGDDYRLKPVAEQNLKITDPHYVLKNRRSNQSVLRQIFNQLVLNKNDTTDLLGKPYSLPLNQRSWTLEYVHNNAVFIDFKSLAEEDRSFADYNVLATTFSTIFVENVPIFNANNRDACRRFMAFVDIAYVCKVDLYILAAAYPFALYQDSATMLPFERTASRLTEMCLKNSNH